MDQQASIPPVDKVPAVSVPVSLAHPPGPVAGPPERPPIHRGDVLFTLGHEIMQAGQRLTVLEAFRSRVVEAAKDPAEWAALRKELGV